MLKDILQKSVRFDADGGTGSPDDNNKPTGGDENQSDDGGSDAIQTTQADLNKQFAARAKQAKEAERKSILEALGIENLDAAKTLVKAAKDAEDANKTEVERANKRAETAEANLTNLQSENNRLKLRLEFDHRVEELELRFANATAAGDAFNALDVDIVGDDHSGMEKAIKQLLETRDYLFAKDGQQQRATPPPGDGRQKGRGNQSVSSQEQVNQKRSSIAPL